MSEEMTHCFQVLENLVDVSVAAVEDGVVPDSVAIAPSLGHSLARVLLAGLPHHPRLALLPAVLSARRYRPPRHTDNCTRERERWG